MRAGSLSKSSPIEIPETSRISGSPAFGKTSLRTGAGPARPKRPYSYIVQALPSADKKAEIGALKFVSPIWGGLQWISGSTITVRAGFNEPSTERDCQARPPMTSHRMSPEFSIAFLMSVFDDTELI